MRVAAAAGTVSPDAGNQIFDLVVMPPISGAERQLGDEVDFLKCRRQRQCEALRRE